MRVIDIVNAPWALEPRAHDQLLAIYGAYLRGEKIDVKAIEAQIGRPLENEKQAGYETIAGVAVIPVHGVLAKKMNLFSQISGGASTQLIARDIRAAQEDPRVHAILLDIDSPGGAVDGTQALADVIYGYRAGGKAIDAWADGQMTSAAYWIGSAARRVHISGDTTVTGSIGVATKHVDVSKANEKYGQVHTDIFAGKYKRVATENAPLSEEGRAALQEMVDAIYTVFVDGVARNRGTDAETVIKNMADGRLFVGKAAIKAGLVDGVSTFQAAIEGLLKG
jgi:signal peptide peptidase SppA